MTNDLPVAQIEEQVTPSEDKIFAQIEATVDAPGICLNRAERHPVFTPKSHVSVVMPCRELPRG